MINASIKEKADEFYNNMQTDNDLKSQFIAQPTQTLVKAGILSAEETKIAGVDDYYNSLAQNLNLPANTQPANNVPDGLVAFDFWSDAACWSCKISMGAVVAAAVTGATLATGGLDIPALAAALGVEASVIEAGIAGAASGAASLIASILKQICGDCGC